LGDPKEPGLSQRDAGAGTAHAGPERASLPNFPPRPGERERWTAILNERPDLAPATQSDVRFLADGATAIVGTTPRTDWLRALGNGVVVAQACAALRELLRRIEQ
jgi:hypothetical protein